MSDTSTSTSTDSTVSPSASRGTPGCACACWRCPASPRADPASSRATICTPRRAVWSQHGRVRGHGPLRGREDRIPPLLDYSTIFPRWVVCPCSLRDIVRRTLDYYSEFHASMMHITTQKLGRGAAVWLLSWRGSLSRSVRNVTARWRLGNTRTAAEPAEPRTKKTLRISWTVKSSDCTKQKVDTQIHFL